MKRLKFRIETSTEWSEEQMIEEIKKNTPDFSNNGEKQEAIVIITLRKVPNKYMK